MTETYYLAKLEHISDSLQQVLIKLDRLEENTNDENDMWSTSDLIRQWCISERTASQWRKEKLIGYIQVKGTIWYPKSAREEFLNTYLNKSKNINLKRIND